MSIRKSFQIIQLKSKLRSEYLQYTSGHGLSCGKHLADHIQGFNRDACRIRCNELLAQLRQLDPAAANFKDIV